MWQIEIYLGRFYISFLGFICIFRIIYVLLFSMHLYLFLYYISIFVYIQINYLYISILNKIYTEKRNTFAKFSETPLDMAYGREMNIQFTGSSSGGHSCSQHANCTLPQNLRRLWHCAMIKLHNLEWPFIVVSLKHTYEIIMLSNQHLDMPHLWGGWIISTKKCSLTQI